MPRPTQIIPEHLFPHQMVVINDNTTYLDVPPSDSGNTKTLHVFASPKGRDGKLQTIDTGLGGFLEEYGIGPFDLYGQPLLNAYASANSGAATMHCLRVTAKDSLYSTIHIIAKYKLTGDNEDNMEVKFIAKPSPQGINDLDLLEDAYEASTDEDSDGYTEVEILSFAYLGRGKYGDNVHVRVANHAAADKENGYKNYLFEVYVNDGGMIKKEEFHVVFNEDAIIDGVSKFSDAVVNDPDDGSTIVKMVTNLDGFNKLYSVYREKNDATILTENDFDPLLGINKYTREKIVNYTIDTTSDDEDLISLNALGGIPLEGGSDGSFGADVTKATRDTALEEAYTDAFSGITDPYIKSKNKYPTNLILDANYSVPVKQLIAALGVARTDCVTILDVGTGVTTKNGLMTYVKNNLDTYVTNRTQAIDGYAGKIKDPYSNKIITVTSTYWLAGAYPINFQNNESKHIPLAGNNFGVISGFIKNSVYPTFDEDIDANIMDELVENNVNFARINASQHVVRAIQETRQTINSNLSELNNVFILLDIKRDCEKLCATMEFNFSEADDISRFNSMARDLLGTYSVAQVRGIGAKFDKSTWEAERGILHMYVEFANKDLVKTTIIEIDVNR